MTRRPHILIAGGGLAGGLIALRLIQTRPDVQVTLVEAGEALGGEHTWSFFEGDLAPDQQAWIDDLIVHRWDAYDVVFPARRRRLSTGYRSVTSGRLDAVLRAGLGEAEIVRGRVAALDAGGVVLDDQRRLAADAVIDARGPEASPELVLGYQKFVGLELALAAPHGLTAPIIMDAAVDQIDGYRFVYVLPFDDRRLLIEDTRYSDGPALETAALRQGVLDYAAARGWAVEAVMRQEQGVLPVALEGDIEAFWAARAGTARAGLRAALFHPTTGYSLPDAVRLAEAVTGLSEFTSSSVEALVRAQSLETWRSRAFFRLLNRMLFRAARPGLRYKVLERFYGLPEPLIRRFYAGAPTLADKARILAGKPPVPILAAVQCLPERKTV